jgi:predicted CopG family antitoxin
MPATIVPLTWGGAYTYAVRITDRRFPMQKKLTIAIAEDVYEGLHKVIGPRKISKFVEELVRPHVVKPLLEEYARMAKDEKREAEALEWTEATFRDIAHESR